MGYHDRAREVRLSDDGVPGPTQTAAEAGDSENLITKKEMGELAISAAVSATVATAIGKLMEK